MNAVSDEIRRRLRQFGWSARAVKVVTLDGSILWLVSARRTGHSYSVQSETHGRAWKLAWRLAKRLHLTARKPRMILPLAGRSTMHRRAA